MPSKPKDAVNTGEILFSLPIEPTNGSVVVSRPAERVYLLTFTSGEDNRLLSAFCQTISLALDILASRPNLYPPGVLITTSGIPKFYSNGLDIAHSASTPGFWKDSLYALWLRLITYPMPTVAWINGHAFAGGFMVAMMHDYRIMNPHRGYLCLNELELGANLRPPMMTVFREKVGSQTMRLLLLEAHRFKALDALHHTLIDWIGGLPEALTHIAEFKLVQKAGPGATGVSVYGDIKREMYRETIKDLESTSEESIDLSARLLRATREKEEREERVKRWEGRAKL